MGETTTTKTQRRKTTLTEMAPAAMARFHELRETGTDRIESMRDVLANVAAESSYRPRVFVAEPGQATTDADAQARADTAVFQARGSESTADDLASAFAGRRTTETGQPHPADVAAENFPHPYTTVTPATAGKSVATTSTVAAKTKTRTLSR